MPRRPSPQPREWLGEPDMFGVEEARWKSAPPNSPIDAAAREAAVLQHQIVLRMNEQTRSWKTVARRVDISYPQLRKLATGEAGMSLRDIRQLEREFGPLLLVKTRP